MSDSRQQECELFELVVGVWTDDGYPLTTTQSSAGDGRALCRLDTKEPTLHEAIAALESRALDRRGLAELGDLLFQELFAGELAGLYRSNLNVARAREKRLLVRLRFEPPELSALPWEYLHDAQEDAFLAISPETAVARVLPVGGLYRPLAISLPLRVLLVIANPRDSLPLNIAQEKTTIQEALAESMTQGWVELQILDRARVADISQALRRFRPHVFHFVGHGLFDRDCAFLILEDEAGDANLVVEDAVREFFAGGGDTRLVVLNACQTATTSSSRPMVGLAPRILQRQVPAVVAMQYPFRDRAACIFSREFYRSLALADPVDVAVSEARKGIYLEMGAEGIDWGIPVLFMRTPDGRLWQMEEGEKAETAGRLVTPGDRAAAGGVQQGGGVFIQGVGQLEVAGSIVGGDQTTITGSQLTVAGRDLFPAPPVDWPGLVAELQRLVEALDRAVEQKEIDAEEAIVARAEVEAAHRNASKPNPEPDKIAERLSRAREIVVQATAGVGAAAGLVAALTRVIELVRQLVT